MKLILDPAIGGKGVRFEGPSVRHHIQGCCLALIRAGARACARLRSSPARHSTPRARVLQRRPPSFLPGNISAKASLSQRCAPCPLPTQMKKVASKVHKKVRSFISDNHTRQVCALTMGPTAEMRTTTLEKLPNASGSGLRSWHRSSASPSHMRGFPVAVLPRSPSPCLPPSSFHRQRDTYVVTRRLERRIRPMSFPSSRSSFTSASSRCELHHNLTKTASLSSSPRISQIVTKCGGDVAECFPVPAGRQFCKVEERRPRHCH